MKYIIAIIAIAVGTILVLKTEWFVDNFGSSSWAEEKLGTSGGTRLMYKLIGLAIIFIAFLGLTGSLGGILTAIFGRLFGVR